MRNGGPRTSGADRESGRVLELESSAIVDTPASFRDAIAAREYPIRRPATARAALLVAPRGFRLDDQTASDNRYVRVGTEVSEAAALAEHRALADEIAGTLPVEIFEGTDATPDAVFPNNAFATVPGRAIVGRMRHDVRRGETAHAGIRDHLVGRLRYELTDLSGRSDLVAELTGPLVVDRGRGIGFCGLSERCDRRGAEAMHAAFGLELTYVFDLAEGEYHTNVFLAVLASRAVVLHEGSFRDPETPRAIAELYGDRVLRLSDAEKAAFAGNCISLSPDEVWMSRRAAAALRPESRAALASWGFRVRSVPLDEIEKAGGSLRCCVAEIY